MSLAERVSVQWSSHLELLADRLWKSVGALACTPFEKIVIVVNDPATANWLKTRFLSADKAPRVLMNIEFAELSEFLNDYLANLVHNTDPRLRRAALHPFSPGVMTWRIDRILTGADPGGELQELLHYVGTENAPKRRYALAERLARLYDDYQNSRCQMLRNWEIGKGGNSGVPAWQIALYRQLCSENAESYAKDYETAFLRRGQIPACFRQCRAIHVFDVPFMHEPMLRLLEKISETLPVNFWCFSPRNEWMAETPSRREMIRAVRKHREKMQAGGETEELNLFDPALFYDSPQERLLGVFASGARALLWNLCRDVEGNVEIAGDTDALDELASCKIALHSTYSPKRELEAIQDGLCNFFRRHPDAGAADAIILCADWENYAPVVDAVFGSGKGRIPVTVAGGIAGETPFTQSLKALLAFRENRFEVSAVFDLLGFPAIREKFGLTATDAAVLRDMVKKANIHWGFDDADVRKLLDAEENDAASGYPFTWQRGFDRLISEMLYGFPKDEYALIDAGTLRKLHPCGKVESDRAASAAALWRFVSALNDLRKKFAPNAVRQVDEMVSDLTGFLDLFYDCGNALLKELSAARRVVTGIGEAMGVAQISAIETDVFIGAVQSELTAFRPGMRMPGNAVLFAPLNVYTAVPHKMVWVCGLNDGAFPQIERRPSYDLIGKRPSFFDATSRERDAFALLKAVLSAREELALSYVGRDVRTNDDLPPSVLLNDLRDYFDAAKIPVTVYHHPMYAYSRKYFQCAAKDEEVLPLSYSWQNERISGMLRNRHSTPGIIPFPLKSGEINEIALNALADFFSAPHRYLLESRGVRVPAARYEKFYNKERFSASLDGQTEKELVLCGTCDPRVAAVSVECGKAPDESSAADAMKQCGKSYNRKLKFTDAAYRRYNCIGNDGKALLVSDGYNALPETAVSTVELTAGNCAVRLSIEHSCIEVATEEGGTLKLSFFYEQNCKSDPSKNRVWLHHLGGNAVSGGVATVAFGAGGFLLFAPLSQETAKEKLTELLCLAATPLPSGFPEIVKLDDDLLPDEWQKRLWTPDDVITARKSSSAKKQEA